VLAVLAATALAALALADAKNRVARS